MAVYHIFVRGPDRHYHSVYAKRFEQAADAIAFAKTLLEEHPSIEVWFGDVLMAEVVRETATC